MAADAPAAAARVTLHGALMHAAALVAARRATRLEGRSASDVTELSRIGVALSTERDLLTLLGCSFQLRLGRHELRAPRREGLRDAGAQPGPRRDAEGLLGQHRGQGLRPFQGQLPRRGQPRRHVEQRPGGGRVRPYPG